MDRTDASRHVAVLGAGVSGLVAAHRLAGAGQRVTVLEPQSRVGGRALTLRSSFSEGLLAQTGPARFPGDFSRVTEYSRRLGLRLLPFYPESGTVVACLKGQRIENYEPSAEEFWGYTALVNRYPGRAERVTLRMALRLRALARWVLRRPTWMTYRFEQGTDAFAEALAAATQADFRLRTKVESVTQHETGVRLGFTSPEGPGTLDADYAICTIPLTVLRDVRFTPALSPEKNRLMSEIAYHSAMRIFLEMERAYWRDDGYNGFAVTDTLGEIWDPHPDTDGRPALLACYAKDDLAETIGELGEEERIEYALEHLEQIFPGARSHFVRGASFFWNQQPWIRGGWPRLKDGLSRRVVEFRRPEGRVHFAGDFVAAPAVLNTMEGALESGEYAAARVLGAR